jgi:DNA repair exonuclease SbcCD nuclease subunit
MVKLALYGDLHLSERSPRYTHALNVLDDCLNIAMQHGVTVHVFLGDVFEGDPTPNEYHAFLQRVYRLIEHNSIVCIVRGNHESYAAYGFFELLHPMIRVAWNDFLDVRLGAARLLLVPYPVRYRPPFHTVDQDTISGSIRASAVLIADKIRTTVAFDAKPVLVLGHLSIEGLTTRDMDFERHSPNEVVVPLEAFAPAALTKVGHIHKAQQLTGKVGSVGSLYRCSFAEADDLKVFSLVTIADDGTIIDEAIPSPCRGMCEFRVALDDLVPATLATFTAAAEAGNEIKIVVSMDSTDTARYDPTVFDPIRAIAPLLVVEKDVRPVQRVRAPELKPDMDLAEEFFAWCRATDISLLDRVTGIKEKLEELA